MNVTSARHVLGISHERPSTEELRGAWRRFAREHHPDVRPGDPAAAARFAVGRDAYESLAAPATVGGARRAAPPVADAGVYRPDPRGGRILRGVEAAAARPYAFGNVTLREWQA